MKDVRANWRAAILVCRRCSKKLDGGFGPDGDERLAKVLRREIGGGKGRKAALGVVEVGCLKVCPKRGVTVLNGARPDRWLLIAPGTAPVDVLARLGVVSKDVAEGDQAI